MAANNRYPPWTPEETERLIDLYLADKRWTEIAKIMGRSRESCRTKARNLTLTKGKPKGYNKKCIDLELVHDMLLQGYTRDMISDELEVHWRTVYRHVQRYGSQKLKKLWTKCGKTNQLKGLQTPAIRRRLLRDHAENVVTKRLLRSQTLTPSAPSAE